MSERWFGPAETAERLSVSVKALRIYERSGLVAPLRDANGWRAYGPDQQARLHQVLALKRLGLPLSRIAELLAGRLASLDAVLALQQQVLEARRADADHGLALLAAARAKLARDGALSPDDLTQLTKETAVDEKMTEDDWNRLAKPVFERHFTPEEQAQFAARKNDFDQAEVTREWDALIAEGRALQAQGDAGSPQAMDLAERWMAQVRRFTGDDPAMIVKSSEANKELLANPEAARKMPFDLSLMQFVGEAYKRARA